MNYVYQQSGYEAVFFARMTDSEKELRAKNRTMEFLWQPKFEGVNGPYTTKGALYTHLMPVNYNTPCWIPLTYFWNPSE